MICGEAAAKAREMGNSIEAGRAEEATKQNEQFNAIVKRENALLEAINGFCSQQVVPKL